MTVAELIAELQKLDPDAQVIGYVSAHDGDYEVLDGVSPCFAKIDKDGWIHGCPKDEPPAGEEGWSKAVQI